MADLSGMFAQLNKAVLGNPLAGDAGGGLLSMGSQGLGRTIGAATGTESMNYMTPEAKEAEGQRQLGGLDMTKFGDMQQASNIYSKMGNTEQAVAMQTAAMTMQEAQANQAEKLANKQRRDTQNQILIEKLTKEGKLEEAQLVASGGMTAAEYYKSNYENKQALLLAQAKDPYKGSFRETVKMGGKDVPVLFAAGGEPIRVLGEGSKDTQISEVYDPATGGMRQALVNKNDASDIQFLGGAVPKLPTYEVKESNDTFHVWQTNPDGSPPTIVGQYSNMTDADVARKEATANLRNINQLATIDEAINMIDNDDSWTVSMNGVGGFKSWALKYLPGTDARNFEGLITSIKANVGFEELRTLKAEGGTLGQVSNIENILLQSAIRALDTAQSGPELRSALETIRGVKARVSKVSSMEDPAQADALFTAERTEDGSLTGNRLYYVNDDAIAVIGPDGEYLRLETR